VKGAGGGLLIIAGLVALWLALTGKLDLFAEFWGKLVAGTPVASGSGGIPGVLSRSITGAAPGSPGTSQDSSLVDMIKALPHPPKIPASILNDPILQ
jgi:hypothetical protein